MNKESFPSSPILIVDDEPDALKSFELTLRSGGITNMLSCPDSRKVMSILSTQEIEVILMDLTMPHITGDELLPIITQQFPETPVIVVTGKNEIDAAVNCIKDGAFDYMVKPVEKSRLLSGIRRAVENRELVKENRLLKNSILSGKVENPAAFSDIITCNKKMRSLFQYVESIAKSPQPVLITGETGVGKELMAKAVHTLSNLQGPFVSVNTAGIDDNVFSDTLFGHIKGSFTGAGEKRAGLIKKASSGTLLLDEIGDLSENIQVKLLRLLQEREYYPLGSDLPQKSNARVIATTNQDLEALQESGGFRKDLYYRLVTHHIQIPPLRERREDLPLLLGHFLKQASDTMGKKVPTLPDELITLLSNYAFPGNIRELEAIIFDAISNNKSSKLSMEWFRKHLGNHTKSLCPGNIKQLSISSQSPFSNLDPLPTLNETIRLLIEEAVRRTNNNQRMAAELLGITRQRLSRHYKSYQN